MILSLSSASNGEVAVKAWGEMEQKTDVELKDLALERQNEHFTFEDVTVQPKEVLTTPAFTGSNKGRRYSPFTINVERRKPWHTLTGRQHFYIDHEMLTNGEKRLPRTNRSSTIRLFKTKSVRKRKERKSRCNISRPTTNGRYTACTSIPSPCCNCFAAGRRFG